MVDRRNPVVNRHNENSAVPDGTLYPSGGMPTSQANQGLLKKATFNETAGRESRGIAMRVMRAAASGSACGLSVANDGAHRDGELVTPFEERELDQELRFHHVCTK